MFLSSVRSSLLYLLVVGLVFFMVYHIFWIFWVKLLLGLMFPLTEESIYSIVSSAIEILMPYSSPLYLHSERSQDMSVRWEAAIPLCFSCALNVAQCTTVLSGIISSAIWNLKVIY